MIDTHCHINDELYLNNPKEYISIAKSNGVDTLFVIGYDLESSKKAIEIAMMDESVYALIGIHPSDTKKMGENDFVELEKLISNKKVIGIGEIGLDYYWDKEESIKEIQRQHFIHQIKLANKYKLPISVHCRDAQEECLTILKENKPLYGGIMHCYAGSKEMINEYRKLGILLGIGGVVTFKNSVKLKEAVIAANETDLVLETDAPYLTPVPHRGTPNHSKYIPLIASEIANLRGTTLEHVEEFTTNNVKKVFNI